jgi:hypothetical protein
MEVKTIQCQNFYRKTSQTTRERKSGTLIDHLMMRNIKVRTVSPVGKKKSKTMLTGVDKLKLGSTTGCMNEISINIRVRAHCRYQALPARKDYARPLDRAWPLFQAHLTRRCRHNRNASSWMLAGCLRKVQVFLMVKRDSARTGSRDSGSVTMFNR